jgi:hypothetical protein
MEYLLYMTACFFKIGVGNGISRESFLSELRWFVRIGEWMWPGALRKIGQE